MRLAQLVAASLLYTASAITFESYSFEITQENCACNECLAEERRPNEQAGQLTLKCTYRHSGKRSESTFLELMFGSVDHSDSCTVPLQYPVEMKILSYENFCFHHCAPSVSLAPSERVFMKF